MGWQVLSWLKEQDEEIVGLVVHPPEKRSYVDEMLSVVEQGATRIIDGSKLRERDTLEEVKDLGADVALSVFFDFILKPELIELFPQGVVNLHPSYLPYNRGQYPNVWSIIEGTPAGATLHYIDAGIDTGDIIAQRRVTLEPVDTGETLYRKLEGACVELFKENWPSIKSGSAPRTSQQGNTGTYHRARDVEDIDEIDLDGSYTAGELLNILRARTFPPYSGSYFVDNGRKVYLRLQLLYEEQL